MLLFLCSSIRTKGAHAIIHKRVRISSTHFYGHTQRTDRQSQDSKETSKKYTCTLTHSIHIDTHTHTHTALQREILTISTTRTADRTHTTRMKIYSTMKDIFHHEGRTVQGDGVHV